MALNSEITTPTDRKTVRYFCNLGYALQGEAQLTCEDGKWNAAIPKCKG